MNFFNESYLLSRVAINFDIGPRVKIVHNIYLSTVASVKVNAVSSLYRCVLAAFAWVSAILEIPEGTFQV